MRKDRVAVLYANSLFGQGLAHLLRSDRRLEVTSIRADPETAPAELARLRPDAIVIEDSEEAAVRRILQHVPPVLLIKVRLQDNLIDIYYNLQVVAAGPEDLLEAIHTGLKRRHQAPAKG